MTELAPISKRQAVKLVARKYRRGANEVYAAVEKAKKSAK
jgi:hypothetical protein